MSDYKGVLHETAVRFPDTDIWMDSCGEEELDYGLARGIVGATSNPIIVGAVVKKELPYWEPRIRRLIAENPSATEDEITWLLLYEVGLETVRDICLAHICDDSAKTPECAGRCGEWRAVLSRAEALAPSCCLTLKGLAVDGKALSGLMEPSPEMGKALKFLLDEVINGNFPNEREFLLKEAAKYIAKRQKT